MIVFHHNDADGRCAAAIVLKWAKENGRVLRFVEMDYSMSCPLDIIKLLEMVVIVDFSFKPEVMERILNKVGEENIIWCDHHVTAKEYDYGFEVKGRRDFSHKGLSGCELTWAHFFSNEPLPLAVNLIGDYDAWRLEMEPECFEFYEGLKLEDQHPEAPIWTALISASDKDHIVHTIKSGGKVAIKYRDNYCADLMKAHGYETVIGMAGAQGYQAYATNMFMFGSKGFGEKFKQYPICIAYIHNGEKFIVSLYSETVDVSEIAKFYGGGGHKGAAGFACESLPFTIKRGVGK